MEIGVKVEAENSYSGETHHVVSAYFTFVALDEKNIKTNVPEFVPQSDAEVQRHRDAGIRRGQRLQTREMLKA